MLLSGCGNGSTDSIWDDPDDYRQAMRGFVEEISSYAKELDSDFIIIPQNGHVLPRLT